MDYLQINKDSWNERVTHHLGSEFYDLPGFRAGESSLKEIELGILGNVEGKSLLHLQCHFGQDTLSLARLGARAVGVDLSDQAINTARQLNDELELDARFVESDVYSAPEVIDEQFDIVFTSYGTIGWLPDIDRWAEVVAHFLKPGGRFVFAEFHPVIWMFDDDFKQIVYRYFRSEPIVEENEGTYADPDAPIRIQSVSWNHGLSEVMSALLRKGLAITHFEEFDFSPWNCFPNLEESEPGRYRFPHWKNLVPLTYRLVAESQQMGSQADNLP